MNKLRALYTKHLGYKLELKPGGAGSCVVYEDNKKGKNLKINGRYAKIIELLSPWFICFIGALFYCYEYTLRVFPSVVAQPLINFFDVSAAGLGGLSAFYYYAYDSMQLPVGLLVDHFSIKKLLVFAVAVCAVGGGLFLFRPLYLAEMGRLLVGFGSAFAFVSTLKLIAIWLPANRFAFASGAALTIGMLGAALSDVVLGNLARILPWRVIGCVLALTGLLLAAFIWFKVPERKEEVTKENNIKPHIGIKQLYQESWRLLKNVELLKIGIVGCLLYLPLSLFAEFWSIPFLHQAYNVSNQIAAHITSLIFIGVALGSLAIGLISDLLKKRCVVITVCSSINAGLFYFVLLSTHINTMALSWIYFFIGVLTSAQVLVFALAREAAPAAMTGTAIAIINMITMFGGIFQPLVGFLLVLVSGIHATGNLNVYPGKYFRMVLFLLPLCITLGCYITLKIKDNCAKLLESN